MWLRFVVNLKRTMGAPLTFFPMGSSIGRSDSRLAPARGPLRAGFLFADGAKKFAHIVLFFLFICFVSVSGACFFASKTLGISWQDFRLFGRSWQVVAGR